MDKYKKNFMKETELLSYDQKDSDMSENLYIPKISKITEKIKKYKDLQNYYFDHKPCIVCDEYVGVYLMEALSHGHNMFLKTLSSITSYPIPTVFDSDNNITKINDSELFDVIEPYLKKGQMKEAEEILKCTLLSMPLAFIAHKSISKIEYTISEDGFYFTTISDKFKRTFPCSPLLPLQYNYIIDHIINTNKTFGMMKSLTNVMLNILKTYPKELLSFKFDVKKGNKYLDFYFKINQPKDSSQQEAEKSLIEAENASNCKINVFQIPSFMELLKEGSHNISDYQLKYIAVDPPFKNFKVPEPPNQLNEFLEKLGENPMTPKFALAYLSVLFNILNRIDMNEYSEDLDTKIQEWKLSTHSFHELKKIIYTWLKRESIFRSEIDRIINTWFTDEKTSQSQLYSIYRKAIECLESYPKYF